MLTQPIALVPEAGGIAAADLARVSAALQMQVTRDLAPAWGLSATVDSFPRLEDVPVGYWPIIVSLCELGREAGAHLDENGQPYAQVEARPGCSRWSLAASQACLEMLVNPFGDRAIVAPSLRSQQGAVEFALEVTGPRGGTGDAYFIHDVLVSDFCLPAYFGSARARTSRLTFCDALSAPFQLLPGGHLTWLDPVGNEWWLRSYWDDVPVDTRLGAVDRRIVSVRELVRAQKPIATRRAADDTLEQQARAARRGALEASQARAHRLRALLGARLESQMLMDFDETRESETVAVPALTQASGIPAAVVHGRNDDPEGQATSLLEHLDPPLQLALDEQPVPAQASTELPATTPASLPPVEIAVGPYPRPHAASPRLGLLLSASAGALLVLLAWYAQAHTVRSSHAAARPVAPSIASLVPHAPEVTMHEDKHPAPEEPVPPSKSPEKPPRHKTKRKLDLSASKKERVPAGSDVAESTQDDASERTSRAAQVTVPGSLQDLISTRR